MTAAYYGACGNEYCLECRPLFDRDNAQIPGTDSETLTDDQLRDIAHRHDGAKFFREF
ncbi:hypothetical protein FHT44_005089 [Mycolicibacterium sp. BK634]|uniref:hypothetical protein n=1 Tax=Mycolicibacterium sp. BK634 TaxID=2587099 RepID=UPI0016130B1E|nr:hypothetical protein [Mycolicibacterium sp. BK634]MBB3752577.1 hypothetical protein [Mycolicibacterium sp. BK634]